MIYTRSLISSLKNNSSKQDRAHNMINGSDAESYAMARFLLACRGEGYWGSREEDNSKIDLIFSCKHPWIDGERMLILTQVKSGMSYGSKLEQGFELKAKAKSAAIRTSHSICVIWVDRDWNKSFWAYVHPDSMRRTQQYGVHHEISPATIFDLARCVSKGYQGAKGAVGLIIRRRSSNITQRRKKVKEAYKSFKHITSPVLGKIELTRLAWRHMFRSGRRKKNKSSSLDIIPYLGRLLTRWPSTQAITESKQFNRNGLSYQVREHLLKFEGLVISLAGEENEKNLVAHIRIIEEIRYPENWSEQAMISQQVLRRVVLKSAYYKDKK